MKEDDSSYKRGQDNKQLEIAWFRESEGQSPLSEKMTNVGLGDQRQNLKTERERMTSTGLVTFIKISGLRVRRSGIYFSLPMHLIINGSFVCSGLQFL